MFYDSELSQAKHTRYCKSCCWSGLGKHRNSSTVISMPCHCRALHTRGISPLTIVPRRSVPRANVVDMVLRAVNRPSLLWSPTTNRKCEYRNANGGPDRTAGGGTGATRVPDRTGLRQGRGARGMGVASCCALARCGMRLAGRPGAPCDRRAPVKRPWGAELGVHSRPPQA